MATLDSVKLSLRIATNAFDSEIQNLITAALADLHIGGANGTGVVESDPLVLVAVTTYVKMHFGAPEEYDRLKRSYDEQKAQLRSATGYTKWETTEVLD